MLQLQDDRYLHLATVQFDAWKSGKFFFSFSELLVADVLLIVTITAMQQMWPL